MPTTEKIKKSKYLSYQKQGFLYLVFILFLFFTQAGQYVVHYLPVARTLEVLNESLEERLAAVSTSEESLAQLEPLSRIEEEYNAYAEANILNIEKYRENRFAEQRISRGENSTIFNDLWWSEQDQSFTAFVDYSGKSFEPSDFFFHETPNAVVPAITQYTRTIMLTSELERLNAESLVLKRYAVKPLEEAPFVSKYRGKLFLGEDFELTLEAGDLPVQMAINGLTVEPDLDMGKAMLQYTPRVAGLYTVMIWVGEEKFFTHFHVVKPRLVFFSHPEILDCELGRTTQISVDTSFIPNGNFEIVSDHAELSYSDGALTLKPTDVGVFKIYLEINGNRVDSLELFARAPGNIEVLVTNRAEDPTTRLAEAHKLKSAVDEFEVLSYRAIVFDGATGERKEYKVESRLLSEYLAAELQRESTTLVIDEIVLLASDGITRVDGNPIVLSWNE